MDIYITEMTAEHIPQVVEIEKQSFSMPWSSAAFEESFQYEHVIFLAAIDRLAENDIGSTSVATSPDSSAVADNAVCGRVAGYIGMYKVFNEGDITNIAVAPQYRGNGIGTLLMEAAVGCAAKNGIQTLLLEVRQSNAAAIGLYKKMGFQSIGIRRRFYEKPVEDAIVMSLKLLPL